MLSRFSRLASRFGWHVRSGLDTSHKEENKETVYLDVSYIANFSPFPTAVYYHRKACPEVPHFDNIACLEHQWEGRDPKELAYSTWDEIKFDKDKSDWISVPRHVAGGMGAYPCGCMLQPLVVPLTSSIFTYVGGTIFIVVMLGGILAFGFIMARMLWDASYAAYDVHWLLGAPVRVVAFAGWIAWGLLAISLGFVILSLLADIAKSIWRNTLGKKEAVRKA